MNPSQETQQSGRNRNGALPGKAASPNRIVIIKDGQVVHVPANRAARTAKTAR